MQVKRIDEIIAGEKLFSSNGISTIKVTKNGEVIAYQIPIKSGGISELIDSFSQNAPKAPLKNELIEPNSEIGKQMGITKKTWMKMANLADENYKKELQEFETKMGLAIVMKGLDLVIKNSNGEEVKDNDEKIEILKSMGLTGEQFSQIVGDITALTKWSESEMEDFLDSGSA